MFNTFKKKVLRKIRAGLYSLEKSENHIIGKSKVKPSVKLIQSSLNGEIEILDNSLINKSNLSGNILIGKNCKINNAVITGEISFENNTKILGEVLLSGKISVGKYTTINGPNTDLRSAIYPIVIGNFCSIARNVVFQEYNHDFTRLTSYFVKTNMEGKSYKEDIVSKGGIRIGHDVWIGTHCVILSGAKIGTGAVIAANSVVTGEIPPFSIAAGSPAKVIKYRFEKEVIQEILNSEWWKMSDDEVLKLYYDFGKRKSSKTTSSRN